MLVEHVPDGQLPVAQELRLPLFEQELDPLDPKSLKPFLIELSSQEQDALFLSWSSAAMRLSPMLKIDGARYTHKDLASFALMSFVPIALLA